VNKKFTQNQVNRFTTYIQNNLNRKGQPIGWGPNDRHDCITCVYYGAKAIMNNNEIKMATRPDDDKYFSMHNQMKEMKEAGMVSEKHNIPLKDKDDNNIEGEESRPESLSSSVSKKMEDLADQGPGAYAFGLALVGGYHSATVILIRKKDGEIVYYFFDQNKEPKAKTGEELDDYILWYSQVIYDNEKDVREQKYTTDVWQYYNNFEVPTELKPKAPKYDD
jgi:hypothetical protein